MKIERILLLTLLFTQSVDVAVAQMNESTRLAEFSKTVLKHQMQFDLPVDFKETDVISTEQRPINYGIRHTKKRIE